MAWQSSLPTGLLPASAVVLIMSCRLCEVNQVAKYTAAFIPEHHAAVHASTSLLPRQAASPQQVPLQSIMQLCPPAQACYHWHFK